jgi:hypothetical protein
MYISDTLSRTYLEESGEGETKKTDMICILSITPEKYSEIQKSTTREPETLMNTIQTGWPDTKNESPFEVRQYFEMAKIPKSNQSRNPSRNYRSNKQLGIRKYRRWDQVSRRSKHPLPTDRTRREPSFIIVNAELSAVKVSVSSTFDSRDQLSVLDSIMYKGSGIIIPPSLRKKMLNLIHKSHLGIVKSKSRAREVMYWPAMNADIKLSVLCRVSETAKQRTSVPTPTPDLPYSHVGTDVFEFKGKKYLILLDCYLKYIDAIELRSETTTAIIEAMKTVFE